MFIKRLLLSEPANLLAARVKCQRRAYRAVLRLRRQGLVVERWGREHKVRHKETAFVRIVTTDELVAMATG